MLVTSSLSHASVLSGAGGASALSGLGRGFAPPDSTIWDNMNNRISTVRSAGLAARGEWRKVAGLCRNMTSQFRTLPDFLIVGEAKAGTTTLYDLLARHPQVAAAAMKEVHFFDLRFSRGVDWYRAQFPMAYRVRGQYRGPGARLMTGEASPYYM